MNLSEFKENLMGIKELIFLEVWLKYMHPFGF